MNFKTFKEKAKQTGFAFNIFTDVSGFLNSYVAEIGSHRRYIGLYAPNNDGGATLVLGFPDDSNRKILFFDSIDEIKANEITSNLHCIKSKGEPK